MKFIPIKTNIFQPPEDNIYTFLDRNISDIQERDVILITSKIIAIHQGRRIKIDKNVDRDELIKKEAEKYIDREDVPGGHAILTLKHSTLIPSAGIDESNANGYYVLWPTEVEKIAKEICEYLQEKHGVKELAVILTDSHCVPLRYGVVGISIGFYGLEPLKDYKGTKDIFGRELQMAQTNIVDGLAAAAVLVMGEGDECIPMVIARGGGNILFTKNETYNKLPIPLKEDLFYPLLKRFDSNK